MIIPRPVYLKENDPPHIVLELTNTCNLHCSYCSRDDDALHHAPAHFFPLDLLRRVIRDARDLRHRIGLLHGRRSHNSPAV
jgi:MoaA/NifB/PqqE/SkfB family radical SAM enzyme